MGQVFQLAGFGALEVKPTFSQSGLAKDKSQNNAYVFLKITTKIVSMTVMAIIFLTVSLIIFTLSQYSCNSELFLREQDISAS